MRPPNSGGYPGSNQPLSNISRCQLRAHSGMWLLDTGPLQRVGLGRQVFVQKRHEVRAEGLDVSVESQLHGAPGGRKFERLLLSPK